MRYENENQSNKSDLERFSESFLKAPQVTRQVYAKVSVILLTGFIASGGRKIRRLILPERTTPRILESLHTWEKSISIDSME